MFIFPDCTLISILPAHRVALVRKIRKFKMEYLNTGDFLQRNKLWNEDAIKISFWVAHLLAEQGKPFTNGELISISLQQLKKYV